jgi:hypothetical protein
MPVAAEPPVAHAAVAGRLDSAIVRQINTIRTRAGLSRVVATLRLKRLARHHTLDMLRRDSFSHDGDGTTFSQRIKARVHPAYRRIGVSGKAGAMGAHHAFLVTADFATWR